MTFTLDQHWRDKPGKPHLKGCSGVKEKNPEANGRRVRDGRLPAGSAGARYFQGKLENLVKLTYSWYKKDDPTVFVMLHHRF